MIGDPAVILRSIRMVSGEVIINTTLKNGESWSLIDQIRLDKKGVLHANSSSHQITIYPREE